MTALRWIERTLLVLGIALACWCAAVMMEAMYWQHMAPPPPPLTITETVPGDAGSPAPPPPAPGTWVARLEAPSIDLATTVLEGSDDATLRRASGHIEETALPGQRGNVGIAGHRDTTFRPLRNLKVGDPLDLTTSDKVYHYRVASTSIVAPTDVYVLDQTSEPTLTLVTCYPFEFIGHAPRRYIVSARLIDEEARTLAGAGRAGGTGRAGGESTAPLSQRDR